MQILGMFLFGLITIVSFFKGEIGTAVICAIFTLVFYFWEKEKEDEERKKQIRRVNQHRIKNAQFAYQQNKARQGFNTKSTINSTLGSLGKDGFKNLELESKLHQLGYKVGISGINDYCKRQGILDSAIESGELTKEDIVKILEYDLRVNANRSDRVVACQHWEDDLEYINNNY